MPNIRSANDGAPTPRPAAFRAAVLEANRPGDVRGPEPTSHQHEDTVSSSAEAGEPQRCPLPWCNSQHGPIGPGTIHRAFAAQARDGLAVIRVTRTVQSDGTLSAPEIHFHADGEDILIPAGLARDLSVLGETGDDHGKRAFGRLFTAAVSLAEHASSAPSR